jgi:hypothetical protein
MGMLVDVIKTEENERFAYYDYKYKGLIDGKPGTLRTVVGKIIVDKVTNEVHLELAPGDKGAHARAGATALARYVVKKEYPDKAVFQS